MPVVLHGEVEGLACIAVALVACGTWPAVLDLSAKKSFVAHQPPSPGSSFSGRLGRARFGLPRSKSWVQGRHAAHSFLDKVVANFLFCAVAAVTLGQFGESSSQVPSFTSQLPVLSLPHVGIAMVGGVMLMFGNLAMQRAMCKGVPIALVLAVQGALTVVLGTSINYCLQPDLNNPVFVFAGVAAFAVAVLLSALTNLFKGRDDKAAREKVAGQITAKGVKSKSETEAAQVIDSLEAQTSSTQAAPKEEASTQDSTNTFEVKEKDQEKTKESPPQNVAENLAVGLFEAALGGMSFGLFVPAFNIAVNDPFHWLPVGVAPLTTWTANFFFALGFSITAFVATLIRMRYPAAGEKPSTLRAYLLDGGKERRLAMLAGVILAFGNTMQFLGGGAAGFAAAGIVQAFPVIGSIWGFVLFGQFRDASRRVLVLKGSMITVYLIAVVLLALSVQS